MAKLLLKHEGITLSSYPLEQDTIRIGRSADNEIQLDDAAVSTHHAVIHRTPNEYLEGYFDFVLEDQGSTNGTKINAKRITRQLLKHGDAIRIGSHFFIFDSGQVQNLETTAIILPEDE
jgi:pSer/pThr/pTyr-binding forkhead associated (FHA) protein